MSLSPKIHYFYVHCTAVRDKSVVEGSKNDINRIYRKKNILKMAQVKMPYSSRGINAPNYTNDLQQMRKEKNLF